ncbi:MAG TPA: phenylacetate--CoA ligase family protein [Gammaproteobacteria bacterium]|nr:phenylacetate--CoA ligase family protein [Gammaproteobacteria bacterium]
MSSLIASFWSLKRTQWADRATLREMQDSRLRRLIQRAYDHVGYYRRRFDSIGLKPHHIRGVSDLDKIPVTTKAELQAAPLRERINDEYPLDTLTAERTSGSTGQPFTAYFDSHFINVRNALFLRVLHNAGYRPGQKLMLVTGERKTSRPWMRWYYSSIESPAEQLAEEFARYRPSVLYGCMTPLREMAACLESLHHTTHRPSVVISTAESLDAATRNLLERVFGAPVYDIYGLTEMGLVAWECPAHNGYHLSEDTTIVEFIPDPNRNSSRLVMTNLELDSMPLIRFQTGDLAVPLGDDRPCSCGRHSRRIARVDGRMVDCIRTSREPLVSPYRLTLALEGVNGLDRYQILQERVDELIVRIEETGSDKQTVENSVRSALQKITGPQARIEVRFEGSLQPPDGRKFRVVECRIDRT